MSADRRMRDLHRLVESGRYEILSLDLFDTVLWRMVPEPVDVHFLVARRLLDGGSIHDSSSIESYVTERVRAEERARKAKKTTPEVTLAEIFAEFPAGYLRGISPAQAAEVEFEVERSVVRVDAGMAGLIGEARRRGLKIAFVSDTYFERRQIEALATIPADHLILSCEHGLSKYAGLHRVLLERSRVAGDRILHVGNDYRSDVEGPGVFGIERFWYRKYPDPFTGMVGRELPRTYTLRRDLVSSSDLGLTTLRGRAMFHCGDDEHAAWGAGVLGPIVCGFADWVVEKARSLGIERLLCLMREGRILKRVIDGAIDGPVGAIDGSGGSSGGLANSANRIETVELFASRYAALRAAIFEGTEEEIASFVHRPTPQPLERILTQLGLDPRDLDAGDPSRLLSPDEARRLVRAIARNARLRAKVVAASAECRRRLLRHLLPALGSGRGGRGGRGGPGRDATIGIVDLGYRGTIQECLQRICDHEGLGVRTHGLYLVTGGEVHHTQATGAVVEGWLAENGQPVGMAHSFMRSPEIIEQSLMADCGTTTGYAEDGRPILDEFRIDDAQRRQIASIQEGLLVYAGLWQEHKKSVLQPAGRLDGACLDRLKPLYQGICIRSVARPLDVELRLFGGWRHDENFGSAGARTLTEVPDLDPWEKSHISAHQVASLPHGRLYWPFGFAHQVSANMGEAVAGIFLRSVDPEILKHAGPPRPLVFYWDSGAGFSNQQAAVQEYRLNNRGNLWHRMSLKLERGRNRAVGISVGLVGEVLQITGVLVRVEPASRPTGERRVVRFPHEAIEKLGYEPLHGNLYLVREDPALLVVPTEGIEDFTGMMHVDLFFSILSPAGACAVGAAAAPSEGS